MSDWSLALRGARAGNADGSVRGLMLPLSFVVSQLFIPSCWEGMVAALP